MNALFGKYQTALLSTPSYCVAEAFRRYGMAGTVASHMLVSITVTSSLLISLVTILFTGNVTAAEPQPNVILIVIDDLGAVDLGCYGSTFHKTPNIDRLAADGTRFNQAYAAAPIGLPTRTALMTGRYPQRMNLTASFAVDAQAKLRRMTPPAVSQALPLEETTLAELLKPAGYRSACIGKWHLGGEGFGPLEQGFDIAIASQVKGVHFHTFAPYVDEQGNLIPGLESAPPGEYLTDRLADEACQFITANKSKPFFLYLPHFAVHMPADVKPEILAKYGTMPTTPTGKQINPQFAALMESMDQAVGKVVQTLDDLQLSQQTMIVFTSDNGGVCNANGQIVPPTSNAPLRDGMGHLYEGGLRVPFIVKWPGVVKSGAVNEEVISCLDLFPTIQSACQIARTTDEATKPDGVDLLPTLQGKTPAKRDALYWHFPHYNVNAGTKPGAVVRSGDWKLIEFYETGRRELFNVGQEKSESNNLIEKQPEIARTLIEKLDAWRAAVDAKRPTPNADYTPNPQSDDGSILIHSSNGDVYGTMLRYEPLPNKDTLGYWINESDWASFEFTVKRPGRFHVIPHVGCGTAGGSLVEFQIGEQKLPLTVPGTGHFQNFVAQDLGVVELDKPGRYTLTVKPQKKVGVAVMDVRTIELKPVSAIEMLSDLHLLEPFWRSKTVLRESLIFVSDGENQPGIGKLLFPAKKIIAVHSANGLLPFREGVDYVVADGRRQLIRKDGSQIPLLKSSDLFMPKGARPIWTGGPDSVVPCALPHKLGDPDTHMLFDNGHWFHDQQVEVTYEREDETWPAAVPKFDIKQLPKTAARLRAKQKLTIGVSGDSITYGYNASGLMGAPPYLPIYPELVAAQLQTHYGAEVNLVNRAVGGWNVPRGLADLDNLLKSQPDLIIIAYGMNDVGGRNPDRYKSGVQEMITRIKAAQPDTEIILVATMLGNDQWTHTPREMFPLYRDALASLCGEGVALADLTAIWTEMRNRKRDCDLTGNGVNHPSDFGHRVYASAVLSLLIDQK